VYSNDNEHHDAHACLKVCVRTFVFKKKPALPEARALKPPQQHWMQARAWAQAWLQVHVRVSMRSRAREARHFVRFERLQGCS